MAGKADVIAGLPELRWRGLRAPCVLAPLRGAHDQGERRVPYRDAAGHDHTGRQPYVVNAKLLFIETIELGAFTENLPRWLPALEDGTSDKLIHPIRGPIRARVLSWEIDFNSSSRAGVVVDVQWTETVDNFEDGAVLSKLDLDPSQVAEAADAAMASVDIDYPDGLGETSLTDGYDQVKGGLFSASLSISGKVSQFTGTISGIIEDVEALDDPEAWQALDNLLTMWGLMKDLEEKAERAFARATATLVTNSDTTLDAIATQVGNTTGEVMGLNLKLLASPRVPRGSFVTYYKAA